MDALTSPHVLSLDRRTVGLFANIVWYPQVHPTFSIFVYVNHFSPLTDVEESMLNIDFFGG